MAIDLGNAANFEGVTQLWQIGDAAAVTNLAATTTAGFRDLTVPGSWDAVDVSAAAASVSVALDNVDGSKYLNRVHVDVDGLALSSVNISGAIADYDAANPPARLALEVTAGKDVQVVSVNTTLETDLSVFDHEGSTKFVKTVDASASTGGINFDANSTVTTILTGSGDDDVELNTALTSTVKAASVSTGAGDDTITVDLDTTSIASGSAVTVDAGAGNDEIYLDTFSNTKLTFNVNAGDGDDSVYLQEGEGAYRVLTDNDKLDGGAGTDTIVLAAPVSNVLTSGDYIRLQDLQGFEHLRFTSVVGTSSDQLNAADLTGYSQIEVTGSGGDLGNADGVGEDGFYGQTYTQSDGNGDYSFVKGIQRCGAEHINEGTAQAMRALIAQHRQLGDVVIASLHWGANWVKTIAPEYRALARYLIDEAGVDVIHGHSSRHVLPAETYKGKLILYGCGDLINDSERRPDYRARRGYLGALYFVDMDPKTYQLFGLRVQPVQRRRLRLELPSTLDAKWVMAQVRGKIQQ